METNALKTTNVMKSMRISYDLNIDALFEKKLMRLEKSKTKKLSLLTIRLNTIDINAEESPLDIPIARTRITEEGKVFCESMVSRSQFNLRPQEEGEEEEENNLTLEGIRVIADNNNTAASIVIVGDKVDIDFDALETGFILLSVNFTTEYPKAIKKKFLNDPKDAFIYTLYDEGNIASSDKVTFYTEKNFTGQRYTYKVGDSVDFSDNTDHPLNDLFKSVKVGSNCKLIAWEHGWYKGSKKTFLIDTPDMGFSGLSSFAIASR
ncbi:MAG: beta/gamma crystallin domain-containing protein [Pseudomonadota bacterium]